MQLTRHALAWVVPAVVLALGCGNDQRSLSVVFDVDAVSCGVPSTTAELQCSGTIAVGLTTGAGTEYSCVHFEAGDFDAVAEAMSAAIDVGPLPANELIALSVDFYASGPTPTSCPPRTETGPVFLSGSTGTFSLPQGSQPLELALMCVGNPITCTSCESELLTCKEQGGVASCEDVPMTCSQQCTQPDDLACSTLCEQLSSSYCSTSNDPTSVPILDCEGFANQCAIDCNEGNCIDSCNEVNQICSELQKSIDECLSIYSLCTSPDCVPMESCLAPPFPLPV